MQSIAVIGAGVSGLAAADRLRRGFRVTVFEAGHRPGGHINTVNVDYQGERQQIDTGFIVYNERTYPHFTQLLARLNVRTQPAEMSLSVRSDDANLEFNGTNLFTLFAQRRNLLRPRFYRLLREVMRFHQLATNFQRERSASDDALTVDEFARQHQLSRDLVTLYLRPMGAAIWSCPEADFGRFPMKFIARFYHNHGLLRLSDRPQWRVIQGGSHSYLQAWLRDLQGDVRIRSHAGVKRVERSERAVRLLFEQGGEEQFDHVVFACHADQALRLLAAPTRLEREILAAFPYRENEAVLHTDATLLPRRRAAWASWNCLAGLDPQRPPAVTYCMNILQSLQSKHVYNVSLNAGDQIAPDRILARFRYAHPVFAPGQEAAQARQAELIGPHRTAFCGAYWRNGFHEDGLVSGLRVGDLLLAHQASSTLPAQAGAL